MQGLAFEPHHVEARLGFCIVRIADSGFALANGTNRMLKHIGERVLGTRIEIARVNIKAQWSRQYGKPTAGFRDDLRTP